MRVRKFLTYLILGTILIGACTGAFDEVPVVEPTETTIALPAATSTTSTVQFKDPSVPIVSPGKSLPKKKAATDSSDTDINCDDAEDLYDSGVSEDIADYCDYGPDSEWDTEDDYDSWEE